MPIRILGDNVEHDIGVDQEHSVLPSRQTHQFVRREMTLSDALHLLDASPDPFLSA